MELLVQPDDGIQPLLSAIDGARRSVDLTIFRLDRAEVRKALEAAVRRGVAVRALIAHTNNGGEGALRELEHRLLEGGIMVSRTAQDLVRYHGKPMIIDGRTLYLFGFNYTYVDIEKSRSFGVVTRNRRLVREVLRLFDADLRRQLYKARAHDLIVSPQNSRHRLSNFIRKARRQLLIYDPRVSDAAIVRLLEERARSGVDIRIIGRIERNGNGLRVQDYPGKRLHVRAIVRDGRRAFMGSQSLRKLELESRREVGLIFRDRRAVRQMLNVFERDWARTDLGRRERKKRLVH